MNARFTTRRLAARLFGWPVLRSDSRVGAPTPAVADSPGADAAGKPPTADASPALQPTGAPPETAAGSMAGALVPGVGQVPATPPPAGAGSMVEARPGGESGKHLPDQPRPVRAVKASRRVTRYEGTSKDKLQFVLGPLGAPLRALAADRKTTMADIARKAIMNVIDEKPVAGSDARLSRPFVHSSRNVHFHLDMPSACKAELTARARAACMTRGEFVWSLLKGAPGPAVPADFAVAVRALTVSTDKLSALSADMSELLRLVHRSGTASPQTQAHMVIVRSLNALVKDHLKETSVLIDELRPFRRSR